MKRIILSVCSVALALSMFFMAKNTTTEPQAEVFTDNVAVPAAPEVIIGRICMSQPNAICIWVWPDDVFAAFGVFI